MRKPFERTVKQVEKVYNDYIAKYGYTDGIGLVIKKTLGFESDYASNVWRWANKLREYGLYDDAFNSGKKPWTQRAVRWMCDTQIPIFEEMVSKRRREILDASIGVWDTETQLQNYIKKTLDAEIPMYRLQFFDISLLPAKPIKRIIEQKVSYKQHVTQQEHNETQQESRQVEITQHDNRQTPTDSDNMPQDILMRGKPMSFRLNTKQVVAEIDNVTQHNMSVDNTGQKKVTLDK